MRYAHLGHEILEPEVFYLAIVPDVHKGDHLAQIRMLFGELGQTFKRPPIVVSVGEIVIRSERIPVASSDPVSSKVSPGFRQSQMCPSEPVSY
jgi:hypothetical protein